MLYGRACPCEKTKSQAKIFRSKAEIPARRGLLGSSTTSTELPQIFVGPSGSVLEDEI